MQMKHHRNRDDLTQIWSRDDGCFFMIETLPGGESWQPDYVRVTAMQEMVARDKASYEVKFHRYRPGHPEEWYYSCLPYFLCGPFNPNVVGFSDLKAIIENLGRGDPF